MSTLLVTENFPPVLGGTPRWFWELYRRLPRDEVAIAAGRCAGDAAFDRTHDLRVARLPLALDDGSILRPRRWLAYRRAGAALRRVVRETRATALHAGRVLPEGWLALGCGLPFACFVHGEELASNGTSRELTWMARRVFRRADLVIANSRCTAGLLAAEWGVTPERQTLLSPGVDTTRFAPAPHDEAVRAALGWRDRQVVLTVARLQKRKGHDRMLDAIAQLRARWPALLYAVVGDGEERAALAAHAERLGVQSHVRWHGALDDAALVRAYQQCDLFALPNRTVDVDFEGFGMVLLEAQACGRAVLAGTSGGTAETLRAGETGVLVDCADSDALATAVDRLLGDPTRRARMGEAARRWAVERFDFDALAPQAWRLFERLR